MYGTTRQEPKDFDVEVAVISFLDSIRELSPRITEYFGCLIGLLTEKESSKPGSQLWWEDHHLSSQVVQIDRWLCIDCGCFANSLSLPFLFLLSDGKIVPTDVPAMAINFSTFIFWSIKLLFSLLLSCIRVGIVLRIHAVATGRPDLAGPFSCRPISLCCPRWWTAVV